MNKPFSSPSFEKLLHMINESAQRSSTLHRQFLDTRRESLQNARTLIEMQTRGGSIFPSAKPAPRPALFDAHHLDEFGTGKISACFGAAFARYDSRRIPRIPNGDLRMMSRVVAIEGQPGIYNQPASIVVEYDVPESTWYFRDSAYPQIPLSLWMEIALQPCGFLSAYLDTYALVPFLEYNFRNLDGSLRGLATEEDLANLHGKTITTRARLLSNAVSGGSVIQKYAFDVSCSGRALYEGESVFGYFSLEAMANQAGLDGGSSGLPAVRVDPNLASRAVCVDIRSLQQARPGQPYYRLSTNRMNYLDDLYVVHNAGRYGRGYVYASRPVNPRDWFYPCHFFQDPVMPGSLGVEAILEAMQGFALVNNLGLEPGGRPRSLRFGPAPAAAPMTWRYRGQITPGHQRMELEAHLSGIEQHAGGINLLADASLWVDGLRIYEVKNAAIGILEVR